MLLKQLKRLEYLSSRSGQSLITPDENYELEGLRNYLLENGGINSSSAGLVVASNYKWLYKPYMVLLEQSQLVEDEDLEENLYWSSVKLIEQHIAASGSKALLENPTLYYKTLSGFLRSNRLSDGILGFPGWTAEISSAKWMILKGKLKSNISELLRSALEGSQPAVGNKIENRVEPLFNKIVKQLNEEIDTNSLTTAEKIKVMDRLSGLLADMKGERKQPDGISVTHNNVFNVIMENKKEAKQLQRAAMELREGEGYELM